MKAKLPPQSKRKPKQNENEIILESDTGTTKPYYFLGTFERAIEFCKIHYKHYKSCKLNGIEINN